MEENKDEIRDAIALALGVSQSNVKIISITEVAERRRKGRRALLVKKVIIEYEVTVVDDKSVTEVENKMTSSNFQTSLVEEVATIQMPTKIPLQLLLHNSHVLLPATLKIKM